MSELRERRDPGPAPAHTDTEAAHSGIEWIEVALARRGVRLRLAWAFHAREVRFERDRGEGFEPVFPETFSFHPERHEPIELQIQLEDLWADPRRLAPPQARREVEELIRRLLAALPAYLESTLERLEQASLTAGELQRLEGDGLLLAQVLERFVAEKHLDAHPQTRMAVLHLRKLVWRISRFLLASGAEAVRPQAERAFHRWVEEVCLDESNVDFEAAGSPFESREAEILHAIAARPGRPIRRGRDLVPLLSRPGHRDCLRLLEKLEVWFLRQYDVYHSAALIRHAEDLRQGRLAGNRLLSHHSTRSYLSVILLATAPFLAATFVYERASWTLDLVTSAEVLFVNAAALWFFLVRFCWRKDLTVFHASVPRIGAGIIVGYMPVFLIDEVWDLARRPWFPLGVIVTLLGFMTLLYLFVEVQRRIGDPEEAFARAGRIFLLGLVQSLLMGVIVTSLLGPFMVSRTWSGGEAESLAALREITPSFLGELPRIMGLDPIVAFPTALLLMTVLSFFIGTFLQLLWEDLPITEPLGTGPSSVSGIQTGTFRPPGESP